MLHYAKIVTSGLAGRFKLICCGEFVDENCAGLILEIEGINEAQMEMLLVVIDASLRG